MRDHAKQQDRFFQDRTGQRILPERSTTQPGTIYPSAYLANQNMLCENRLPARTLLLPAQKRGLTHRNAGESDRVQLLSGSWKFRYLKEDTNAPVGLFEADVEDMHFAYDVPQETGNHEDCRRVTVFGDGGALTASGTFSFSFHNFTLENLTAARHCDEPKRSDRNYFYLDHRHRGLGSHSCGPEPEHEYELPAEPFCWSFCLKADNNRAAD